MLAETLIDKYINPIRVEKLLKQLISIYSPFFREKEIMDFVYSWFKERKLSADYHHFHEAKVTDFQGTNVIGSLKGDIEGPKILLNGHLDTVEICDGWTKDPLVPKIEGDKLYGLGALDMKGGCAAIMLALEAFANTVDLFSGEIIYTFVSGEEGPYGLGTDALILDGIAENVDVVIIPEPSASFTGKSFPSLCLGARGGWKYSVHLKGRSAHGANPEEGVNAISEASKVLLELEKTDLYSHDKLGKGSICVIEFVGGGAPLSVPDAAYFSIFRHVTIGEDKELLEKEVKEAVQRAGIKGDYEMLFRDSPHPDNDGFGAYVVSEDDPYTEIVKRSIIDITGVEPSIDYFSSVGDFNHFGSRTKASTFILGPTGNNYHAADEYVELESVLKTTLFIYDFLLKTLVI